MFHVQNVGAFDKRKERKDKTTKDSGSKKKHVDQIKWIIFVKEEIIIKRL